MSLRPRAARKRTPCNGRVEVGQWWNTGSIRLQGAFPHPLGSMESSEFNDVALKPCLMMILAPAPFTPSPLSSFIHQVNYELSCDSFSSGVHSRSEKLTWSLSFTPHLYPLSPPPHPCVPRWVHVPRTLQQVRKGDSSFRSRLAPSALPHIGSMKFLEVSCSRRLSWCGPRNVSAP